MLDKSFDKAKYDREHVACPKCGRADDVRSTTFGWPAEDYNTAWCSCGWKGQVNDCVIPFLSFESSYQPSDVLRCIDADDCYGLLVLDQQYTVRSIDPTFHKIDLAEFSWKTNFEPRRFILVKKYNDTTKPD